LGARTAAAAVYAAPRLPLWRGSSLGSTKNMHSSTESRADIVLILSTAAVDKRGWHHRLIQSVGQRQILSDRIRFRHY